jgi:hypothetical protein
MREFRPIVGVLGCIMNCFQHDFPMSDTMASKLVGNNTPWFITARSQQPLEEAFCCLPISSAL